MYFEVPKIIEIAVKKKLHNCRSTTHNFQFTQKGNASYPANPKTAITYISPESRRKRHS